MTVCASLGFKPRAANCRRPGFGQLTVIGTCVRGKNWACMNKLDMHGTATVQSIGGRFTGFRPGDLPGTPGQIKFPMGAPCPISGAYEN